ncbi:hypothetical protein HY416_02765 [Candidatus Kaiserbacteria bacterium]|nr:hypothetical protein [Candidatus Kaiserbacteria bacterium]
MRRLFSQTDKHTSWLLRTALGSLMVIMIAGATLTFKPKKAEAYVLVEDVVNWVENAISAIAEVASEALVGSLEYKEYVLDGILSDLAKLAMQEITNSTIRWINSGFEGSPAFVTDLDQFLINTADKAAGEFIYGSNLNFLCSPFQLDVRIALQLSYDAVNRESVARCSLSEVVGNVDNFFNDPFAGGIDGWFALTVLPSNNFFSAYDISTEAMLANIARKKEINITELAWGSGFLSKKECHPVIDTRNGSETQECGTVTPGDTISEALTFELSTGSRTLLEADEINEVISALFTQLSLKALEGAGGLLGLTKSEEGQGGTSYIDRINDPRFDRVPGSSTIESAAMGNAIKSEQQYRDLYAGLVSRADAILERIKYWEALAAKKSDKEKWVCSDLDSLRDQATQIREGALEKQGVADKNLAVLRDLEAREQTSKVNSTGSSTAGEERLRVAEEFVALQRSGTLHSATNFPRDKKTVEPIEQALTQIAAQVESSCQKVAESAETDDE